MQNNRNIFRNLAILATICCGAANATPIRYDVNDVASNNTQAGYLAVDLNGSNNVLFTGVGGATIEDRDRNADNTNGAGGDTTNNDMWKSSL